MNGKNRFFNLDQDEITNLYNVCDRFPKQTRKNIQRAYHYLVFKVELDELHDDNEVFNHHEGVCPICGCGLLLKNEGPKNKWGQQLSVGKCREGHTSYAEPTESSDWVWYGN